jgi:hypothetical protein
LIKIPEYWEAFTITEAISVCGSGRNEIGKKKGADKEDPLRMEKITTPVINGDGLTGGV